MRRLNGTGADPRKGALRDPGDARRGRGFASEVSVKESVMIYGLVSGTTETLRDAVLDEIVRDPSLRAWEIGITAEEGVVTLTGWVDSYTKRWAAEDAAHF